MIVKGKDRFLQVLGKERLNDTRIFATRGELKNKGEGFKEDVMRSNGTS